MKIKYFLAVFVLLAVFQFVPATVLGQESNADLLTAIRQIIADAVIDLKTEIADLKNQIAEQKAEIEALRQESQSTVGTGRDVSGQIAELKSELRNILLNDREFRRGDFDPGIEGFQQCLVEIGELSQTDFDSGRGNYGPRTSAVISRLQRQYGFSETGIFDRGGRNALFLAAQAKDACGLPPGVSFSELERGGEPESTPPPITPPLITPPPITPPPITPTETETAISLVILEPASNVVLIPGNTVPLRWQLYNAQETLWIVFKMLNRQSFTVTTVRERNLAGAGVISASLTIPSTLDNGNYDLIAELYSNSDTHPVKTASISVTVGTDSGETSLNTTSAISTVSDNQYADFYKGTAFTTCMGEYPETIALIHDWIDQGLLRYQFPWGEITGAAANKVAECEGGTFYDDDIPYYGDCTGNATEPACYEQPGCAWFGTFCSGDDYDPSGGTDPCASLSAEASCVAETNCHWYDDGTFKYCYYDGGTSPTSEMYSCFYPNATINGEYPGYTVWCEYDYQNCHVGDQNGDPVSLDGLSLGAPSSCESGYSGSSSLPSESFLANILSNLQNALGVLSGMLTR